MILIDSAHENQDYGLPEDIELIKISSYGHAFYKELSKLNHEEILEKLGDSPYWKQRHEQTHQYYADLARPEFYEIYAQLTSSPTLDDFAQGLELRPLGNIPLVVISQKKFFVPYWNEEQNAWVAKAHKKNATELASLSTDSKQIKVDCGHDICNEMPEIVIKSIREMVEKVRKQNKISRNFIFICGSGSVPFPPLCI